MENRKIVDKFDIFLDNQINAIKSDLNPNIALWVKQLRQDKESNSFYWEDIATKFIDQYPEFAHRHHLERNDSVSGIALCEASRLFLNDLLLDWI